MGHDKLRKFAENETFRCLLQPSSQEILADGYLNLKDASVKGNWNAFFEGLQVEYSRTEHLSESASPTPPSSMGPRLLCRGRYIPQDIPSGNASPVVLELGCGKGEYTVALGERNPAKRYIGVDIKGARLWKGAKYATQNALANVAFLRTRIELVEAFFGPGEIDEIWLTFSDPQYKRENARLSSPIFLERYRKFLKPGGIVRLKTDSRYLYEYTRAVCAANGLEVLVSTEDLYGEASEALSADSVPAEAALDEARAVQTFYETMFRSQGYKINYIAFRIDSPAALVSPSDFDSDYWRSVEGDRQLFGRDTAETRRQKMSRE